MRSFGKHFKALNASHHVGLTSNCKIGSSTVRIFLKFRPQTDTCVALQVGDKHRVTTPVNWHKGDDVIVHPSVSNDEAKTLFPDFTIHKVCFNIRWRIATLLTKVFLQPYLRTTPLKLD